jgi:hypothetical protein
VVDEQLVLLDDGRIRKTFLPVGPKEQKKS